MDKSCVLKNIVELLIEDKNGEAKLLIQNEYPHKVQEIEKRSYTLKEKMEQFLNDGFIDRYSGKRLVNPGILKIISFYFPEDFPYHSHWKMTNTHIAFWDFVPTIDHIVPIARGGIDSPSNWVSTSMKNNSIKNNYSLDEIGWKVYPKGDLAEWDGLTKLFIMLVEKDENLKNDSYIYMWYKISKIFESKI